MSDDKKREVEKSAALKTYVMWAWLEKNPYKWKVDYPLYHKLLIGDELFDCAWCSLYSTFLGGGDCQGCPLAESTAGCCTDDNSFYNKYQHTKCFMRKGKVANKLITGCAGDIARIAWAEYKRLGG